MDVPSETLDELKCSSCELYLSRSPVYLQHDGAAVCRRCYTPERPATRNKLYEATARLLKFPCKYREFGCRTTVPYDGQEEEIAHEERCQYRPYHCPVRGSARCDFLGTRTEILQHCQTEHWDKTCTGCSAKVTVLRYRSEGGWQCERCAPARRACENHPQGCTYTDIDNKCSKHEYFFCQQRTQCLVCGARVSRGSLSAHYGSVHQDITHGADSTWRATGPGTGTQHCLVSSVAGTAVCEYWLQPSNWLQDSQFGLEVYIMVSSERMREFRCEVRVTDPTTGLARTFTPPAEYDQRCDWLIETNTEEFPSCSTELDVCVNIRKTHNSVVD